MKGIQFIRHDTAPKRQGMKPLPGMVRFLLVGVMFACGTIQLAQAELAFQQLHAFFPTNGNPQHPMTRLVQTSDGNFYGTARKGGAYGYGAVFKMTPDHVVSTLVDFGGTNGGEPFGGLVQGY